MMELFVVMTLSFMVGSLLAGCVAFMLVLNKKFMKFYTKKVMSISNDLVVDMISDYDEDKES